MKSGQMRKILTERIAQRRRKGNGKRRMENGNGKWKADQDKQK